MLDWLCSQNVLNVDLKIQDMSNDENVNTFLLTGDKFMPEKHLKQPGFTYSASGSFCKKQKKNWKVYADWKYRFYLQKWAW